MNTGTSEKMHKMNKECKYGSDSTRVPGYLFLAAIRYQRILVPYRSDW
jgi:hypothetical protein